MRIAVITDIHANLHALEAVWRDLESRDHDQVYCLGDLVGYGAFPNEVVASIRERATPTVMGNYDEGVGFDLYDCGCVYRDPEESRIGYQSLLWTRQNTTRENKLFLQSLPLQIRLEDQHPTLLLVHGSPRKINEYLYEDRPRATFESIGILAGTDVLLFGHTHIPYQKQVGGVLFVNAGSVGKPGDGDPGAGYIILDLNGHPKVEFYRISYDVTSAADAIRDIGLPSYFADQLETGGLDKVKILAKPSTVLRRGTTR
jgi:putative phosphoesterase